MRGLLLFTIVFGSIPFILRRPWIGILMFAWISLMNPHRLSFGVAYDFPFAYLIALVTLVSMLLQANSLKIPWYPPVVMLLLFAIWMNVTTIVALERALSFIQWKTVMKTMLMLFATMAVVRERRQLDWLVWVVAGSIAFYGIKGGVFTLRGEAAERVWGPSGSYIEDNNALATALIMVVPILWYIRIQSTRALVRWGMIGTIALCFIASFGSYSRGALLAVVAMAVFFWFKSRNKPLLTLFFIVLIPVIVTMMPQKWYERMSTIGTYQTDNSAQGRLNAWAMAFNLAKERPLTGGGFEVYVPWIFERYAPNPEDLHAAHSIYAAALGEHGFVGLLFFLLFGITSWRTASLIIRKTARRPDLRWASDLARMIQVSFVAYGVGGAFLSILYYDFPYYLAVVLVLTRREVEMALAKEPAGDQPKIEAKPALAEATGSTRRGEAL